MALSTPESDRYGYDANYLGGRIIGALGGMAAEQEDFNIVTTGAENDLEMVTRIARSMVGRWGMSERIGTLSVLPPEGVRAWLASRMDFLNAVDEEIRRITDECYAEARRLLRENRARLDAIVPELLAHESLDERDLCIGWHRAPCGDVVARSGARSCGRDLEMQFLRAVAVARF